MILTESDCQKIMKGKIKEHLSFGTFYIKEQYYKKYAIREVIGKRLADIIGIISAKIYIVLLNNKYYVLSEDLNNLGTFKLASSFINTENSHSLYEIWFNLENNFKNTPELMEQIIKIFLYDIFFIHFDRNKFNWGFIKDNHNIKVAIFDNEYILEKNDFIPYISPYLKEYNLNRDTDDYYQVIKDFIIKFLKESSTEYINLFLEFLNLWTPEYLRSILLDIKQNEFIITKDKVIPLDFDIEPLIGEYIKNYDIIKETWKEYSHAR